MGLDPEVTRLMQGAFARREISKSYLAIVRGWLDESGVLDRPLRKHGGGREEALTNYRTLAHATLPYPVGNYPEARYSLVRAEPVSGRRHQIRRHLSNASHPIVGDAVHGDGKHNRLFRSLFNCYHLLLHAERISFQHPVLEERITLTIPPHNDFLEICHRLGWESHLETENTRIPG